MESHDYQSGQSFPVSIQHSCNLNELIDVFGSEIFVGICGFRCFLDASGRRCMRSGEHSYCASIPRDAGQGGYKTINSTTRERCPRRKTCCRPYTAVKLSPSNQCKNRFIYLFTCSSVISPMVVSENCSTQNEILSIEPERWCFEAIQASATCLKDIIFISWITSRLIP